MTRHFCFWLAPVFAVGLSGCASLPHATVQYRPAIWNATVTVNQLVFCTGDDEAPTLNVASDFSAAAHYRADENATLGEVPIKALDHGWGSLDLAVNLTEDGRLTGINTKSTGQGEVVVAALIQLVGATKATTLFGLGASGQDPTPQSKACAIAKALNKNGPALVSHSHTFQQDGLQPLLGGWVLSASGRYPTELTALLPKLMLKVDVGNATAPLADGAADANRRSAVILRLQRQRKLTLTVSQQQKTQGSDAPAWQVLGNVRLQVPDTQTYELPILRTALFGTQSFALAVSPSGAVTELKFGKGSGAGAALGSLNNLAAADGPAARAAALKAQADELAQRQRLLVCQTDSSQCK